MATLRDNWPVLVGFSAGLDFLYFRAYTRHVGIPLDIFDSDIAAGLISLSLPLGTILTILALGPPVLAMMIFNLMWAPGRTKTREPSRHRACPRWLWKGLSGVVVALFAFVTICSYALALQSLFAPEGISWCAAWVTSGAVVVAGVVWILGNGNGRAWRKALLVWILSWIVLPVAPLLAFFGDSTVAANVTAAALEQLDLAARRPVVLVITPELRKEPYSSLMACTKESESDVEWTVSVRLLLRTSNRAYVRCPTEKGIDKPSYIVVPTSTIVQTR